MERATALATWFAGQNPGKVLRVYGFMGFEWLPDVWWAKWAWFTLGPFFQEDVAILTSAGYATRGEDSRYLVLFVLWLGVIASDLWKYFIGVVALKHPKARDAKKLDRIQAMEAGVKTNLGVTLMTVRFMPLARIPTYAACGYFKVKYWRFVMWIVFASGTYILLAYTAYRVFGAMVGEQLRWILPVAASVVLASVALRVYFKWRSGNLLNE